jgi:hypothetical protein
MTARALRRERSGSADDFPEDVAELMRYLGPRTPDQRVIAMPGTGTNARVAAGLQPVQRATGR